MDLLRAIDRRVPASLVVAVVVVASSLVAERATSQLLSPGPLSRDHAELEGDDKCGRCHSTGRRVDRNQCLSCHTDLRSRIQAGQGLHGREYRNRDCGQCHVDHLGRNAPLVRWPGGNRDRFDHRLSGWPLRGAHARVECRECHDRRNARGHATFLGAPTACAQCHDDPHAGRFGNQCQSCHDEGRWSNVRMQDFDHSRTRFPLRGAHQRVQCRACHGEPARYRGIEFASCTSCHRDPHFGRHGENCVRCHSESSWTDQDRMRREHPGTPLINGHARVACRACHDQGLDHRPSQGDACAACHRPVHEANFGRNCQQCHASIKWTGLQDRIGRRAHSQTPFPLRGRHESVDCAACHKPEMPRAQRYRGLEFDACKACHSDRHDGEFAQRDGGECAPCHSERGFRPTLFGVRAHATTSFPLEGRHEAVACGACHTGARPRLSFRVERDACADCHENPHGDQFAREMAQGGCAHCHSPGGWDRPNIDHSVWPLTGAHAQAHCNQCHSPSEADRRAGRGASYRGVPRDCGGCHDDRHAGQFRLTEPRRECDFCHETSQFEISRFDHRRKTGYALTGAHRQVECAQCHTTVALADGTETERWRLGYRECSDCHANPHVERGGR